MSALVRGFYENFGQPHYGSEPAWRAFALLAVVLSVRHVAGWSEPPDYLPDGLLPAGESFSAAFRTVESFSGFGSKIWQAVLAQSCAVRDITHMDITETFRAALREATDCSVATVAQAAGRSRTLFERYLNRTSPSASACVALAGALEDRSQRLAELAQRLRQVAEDEAGGTRA